MARYFFSLRDGRVFEDVDGLDLADLGEARAEAIGFARDLIRLEPQRRDWSRWFVRVTDEDRQLVFEVPFSDVI